MSTPEQPEDQLSFHNPYHFVPVEKTNHENWFAVKEFDNRKLTYYGHDRYYPDTCSGRIVCCLTTESPIVIGGEREKPTNDKEPATVKPFELTPGQPAIPASSLRGLLSSIAEAASNSALRVLDDKVLSYRKAMRESLSALGMVVIGKDEQGKVAYCLKPLTLPTLKKDNRGEGYTYNVENDKKKRAKDDEEKRAEEKRAYALMFRGKLVRLKVYIDGYNKDQPSDFLKDKETFSITKPEYYYALLGNHHMDYDSFILKHDDFLRGAKKDDSYIIGQKTNVDILTHEKWQSKSNKAEYTRGILRVLGKKGRDLPNTKTHEFFIPYPEEAEKWPDFPILPEAIERFEQLADERTKAEENPPLPYEPLGTKRNEDHEKLGEKLRLKEGDIVYFRPTLKGEAVVAEIAFSSIWRGRVESQREVESQGEPAFVEAATVHDFFKEIDPELLPFHKDRKCISPAELLFGFVQKDNKDGKTGDARRAKDNKDGKTGDTVRTKDNKDERISDAGRALAGRVQVSFGQLAQKESSPYGDNVLLKSLLSPNLPCPTMYFKNRNGSEDYIEKSKIKLGKHCPQGRKMYLHHPPENGETPWVSEDIEEKPKLNNRDVKKTNQRKECKKGEDKENLQIKACATPIRKGLQFYFHLDFNNLDDFELGLLFYALRPYDEFRHKLGMGKAIGLGKVRIDPVGVFLIDRDQRYRVDDIFQAPRYHQVWVATDAKREEWSKETYGREKQAEGTAPKLHWETLREKFRVTMTGVIRKALELLGDPAKVTAVVHTPQIFTSRDKEGNPLPKVNEAGMERENFKWFVANEPKTRKNQQKKLEPQSLIPLNENSEELPTLKRID